ADWRSLYDGAARGGARDSFSGREACGADALRYVSCFGGTAGSAEAGGEGHRGAGDSRIEAGRKPMVRSENLRSGYIQDDVEEYLYKLLPERDAVIGEMEKYAEEHRVPIIGPAVARLMTLLVQVSGAKRIFEMGSAIGYSTIWLARAAGPQAEVFYTDGDPEN